MQPEFENAIDATSNVGGPSEQITPGYADVPANGEGRTGCKVAQFVVERKAGEFSKVPFREYRAQVDLLKHVNAVPRVADVRRASV
jgi:hypothetical protein